MAFLSHGEYLAEVHGKLKEWYRGKWSYEQFTEAVGLGKCKAILLIIQGSRPLTPESANRIARGLGLVGPRREYFEKLSLLPRAEDETARSRILESLFRLRAKTLANEIDGRTLEYFSDWVNVATLELLHVEGTHADPVFIAQRLRPKVKPERVEKSLALLAELGLTTLDPVTGVLKPSARVISTGADVRGLAFLLYHRQMLELAMQSLAHDPGVERDMSAMTIPIRRADFLKVRELTAEFRRKLADLSDATAAADEVYQVNVQCFPVTKEVK